jgi:uncharacterized SAM-binding protein YcdF (DUF218 family)
MPDSGGRVKEEKERVDWDVERGQGMTGSYRLARLTAFTVVVATLIGFGAWSGAVSGYDTPNDQIRADAIVILTGDEGRLTTGSQLLTEGVAPRLLISGVHQSVTNSDIQRFSGLTDAAFNCCVELDRRAADTAGNAAETAQWAEDNGHQRLIIVTSDYHLPRSLLFMEAAMPGVELIPYPVRTAPPWHDAGAARLWVQEYAKFATVWLGFKLTTILDSNA